MLLSCRNCLNARQEADRTVTACGIGRPLMADRLIVLIHEATSFCEELTLTGRPP
jgi:hypothetical protein